MKAAAGKIHISPSQLTQSGKSRENEDSPGNLQGHSSCNILILNDGSKKICLLSFDTHGISNSDLAAIKNGIENETGILTSDIMICTSGIYYGSKRASGLSGNLPDEVIHNITGEVTRLDSLHRDVILKSGKVCLGDLDSGGSFATKGFQPDSFHRGSGYLDDEVVSLSVMDTENNLIAALTQTAIPYAEFEKSGLQIPEVFPDSDGFDFYSSGSDPVILMFFCTDGHPDDSRFGGNSPFQDSLQHNLFMEKRGGMVPALIKNSTIVNGKIHLASGYFQDQAQSIPGFSEEPDSPMQGFAIGSFLLVALPFNFGSWFCQQVRKLSPYKTTVVVGQACPVPESGSKEETNLSEGEMPGNEKSGRSELKESYFLLTMVNEKLLEPLARQGRRFMVRKTSDNKYLHRDFHLSQNLLMDYIYCNFGENALTGYLEQFTEAYFQPVKRRLQTGDLNALLDYFTDLYQKEEWPVKITSGENSLVIEQESCPAISYIRARGSKPCPGYRETYHTIYKTLCRDTPFEYILEYFDNETGACRQMFIRKGGEQ